MNNTDEDYVTIDLRKIFFQIWQNKVSIILITSVFALAGFLISSFVIKPTYSASAKMYVTNRAESQSGDISQSDLNASSTLVSTYSVILKSHDVIEQVIADCGLTETYEAVSSKISISSVSNTQVMQITVRDGDPQKALDIVSAMVEIAPDAIMQSMSVGSVTTVDSPWTTGKPVSPSIKKWTAAGGMLGLLLCLGEILIRELTNDKFKTTEDVRTVLDWNVLGVIPVEETASTKVIRKKKKSTARKRRAIE